jgi:hypothetical protein
MALNLPSNPTIGDIYTDIASGFSYLWDGTAWKSYIAANDDLSAITASSFNVSGITTLGSSTGVGTVTVGSGLTALLVEGNARITGILTIGTSSIAFDGANNTINVGSGVTIYGNTGIISATTFIGDGSGLTGAGSTVSDDTTTNSTFYPVFTATTSGTITDSKVSTTKLSFNPASGRLSTSQLFGSKIINYSEQVNALGNTGASKTITISDGSFVTATLDQSTVFTFSSPGSSDFYGFTLLLTNGAGGPFTITWPASVKWPSNTTPVRTTADGKSDIWTFNTIDNGVTWYGYIAVYDFS